MPNNTTSLLDALRRLFPACVTEAQGQDGQLRPAIDFDALRQELSDCLIDGPAERYQLNWPGKRAATLAANEPCVKTLRPGREESVNFETTKNLFIEGDNLDALKLLLETYLARIKTIYIDPTYNTGKDFLYSDKFTTDKTTYQEETGTRDEEGARLVANPDTSGRYHSNWLSMMYPRLKLARNLLSQDGVIFISIDDHEQHNLRKLMDEIFGSCNFVAQIVRKSGVAPRQDAEFFATEHDYVFCYAKNIDTLQINLEPVKNLDTYTFTDEHESHRGKYKLNKLDRGTKQWSASLRYPITAPDGTKIWPGGQEENTRWIWTWSESKFQWGIQNDFIIFKKNREGTWSVYLKQYQKVDNENKPIKRTNPPRTLLTDGAHNELGSRMLSEMFGGRIFAYPKPVQLLEHLLRLATCTSSSDSSTPPPPPSFYRQRQRRRSQTRRSDAFIGRAIV